MSSSKVWGPNPLSGGSHTNTTYYKQTLRGVTNFYARKRTTLTREKFMEDPNFQNARDNGADFATVMKAVKSVYKCIPMAKKRTDADARADLIAMMHKIKAADTTSLVGRRSILFTSYMANYLDQFELNEKSKWSGLCGTLPYTITKGADKVSATFNIPAGVNLREVMNMPDDIDAVKIIFGVHLVSDIAYNEEAESTLPVNGNSNLANAFRVTDELSLDVPLAAEISLEASLGDVDTESCQMFFTVGANCYRKIGANYYLSREYQPLMISIS